jgi:hypothetical protein
VLLGLLWGDTFVAIIELGGVYYFAVEKCYQFHKLCFEWVKWGNNTKMLAE